MPGGKDNQLKPIAEKYSIDYYRRPLATRRWKRRWNYAALGVALAIFAGIYLLQRNAVFQAEQVSAAHYTFAQDCGKCHQSSWQTALRLVTIDPDHRSVSDQACRDCHQATTNHAAGVVPAENCAACHQEHRPERELTAVINSRCVDCHQELHRPDAGQLGFVASIDDFGEGGAGHPEFALLRANDADVGAGHAARIVGRFVESSGDVGKWVDRGGLKFNHEHHLNPKGVKAPGREVEVLECADCHVESENGRYMQPVNFEQHCKKCHPLTLSDQLSALGEAPHGSVDEVYGFLRRAKVAARNISGDDGSKRGESAAIHRDAVKQRLPPSQSLSEKEESELHKEADNVVFGREANRLCSHCHHVVVKGDSWAILTEDRNFVGNTAKKDVSVRSMVPDRWFGHAQFDHKSHRAIACGECHPVAESKSTADILMPSIATCRSCHGNNGAIASASVSADCVLCHTYHDQEHATSGVKLDELLTGLEFEAKQSSSP